MTNSTEINSVLGICDSKAECRELVIAIAGPFKPGDKLQTLFWAVAERAGLAPRMVSAAWHGEPVGQETLRRLQEAAAHARTREIEDIAARLESLAEGRDHRSRDRLYRAAGVLRGVAQS